LAPASRRTKSKYPSAIIGADKADGHARHDRTLDHPRMRISVCD